MVIRTSAAIACVARADLAMSTNGGADVRGVVSASSEKLQPLVQAFLR